MDISIEFQAHPESNQLKITVNDPRTKDTFFWSKSYSVDDGSVYQDCGGTSVQVGSYKPQSILIHDLNAQCQLIEDHLNLTFSNFNLKSAEAIRFVKASTEERLEKLMFKGIHF